MPDLLFPLSPLEEKVDSDEDLPIAIHGYISEPNGVGTNSSVNPDSEFVNFNGNMHSILKIPTSCGLTAATAIQVLTFIKSHRDAFDATYCTAVSHAPNNDDNFSDSFSRDVVSLGGYSFLRPDIISYFIASRLGLERVRGTTFVDTNFFEKLDNAAGSGAVMYPKSAKDVRDAVFPIHLGGNYCILGIIRPKTGEIWVLDTLRSSLRSDQTLNDLKDLETNLFVKLQRWCQLKFPYHLDWNMMTFDDLPNLTRIQSASDPQTVGKHPHQTDERSCGVFVAIYAHYFITEGRWPTVSDWTEADIPALRLFMASHFLSVPVGSVPVGYCDMAVNNITDTVEERGNHNIAVTVEERGNLLLSDAVVAEGITDDFVAEAFGLLKDDKIREYVNSFVPDLKAIISLQKVNESGTYHHMTAKKFYVAQRGACSDTQHDVIIAAVNSLFPVDSESHDYIYGAWEQVSHLMRKHNMKWFTNRIDEQHDFTSKVLVPEAILRLHMEVLHCTRDTVERML